VPWHDAHLDRVTGCTLDPVADDARGFQDDRRREGPRRNPAAATIPSRTSSPVSTTSVLGLLEAGTTPDEIVRRGIGEPP
jgi:hypothetical protein